MKGKLIITDGIDFAGKSTLVDGLAEHFRNSGLNVFNLTDFLKKEQTYPEPNSLMQYDVIISNEPTYAWTGRAIREEITKTNGRKYSALSTAMAYSLDRLTLYKRVIIPLLDEGKTIINDRSVTTSIVYQPIQAEPLPLEQVLSLEGNALALEYRPDLLLIGVVPLDVALKRKAERYHKQDDSIFENREFLKKADERFRSSWFKEMFEKRGTVVKYIDLNKTIDEEVKDAIKAYESLK